MKALTLFTCEVHPADDPEWRKFSFPSEARRDRMMTKTIARGGAARLATLTRDDVPAVLRDRLPVEAA